MIAKSKEMEGELGMKAQHLAVVSDMLADGQRVSYIGRGCGCTCIHAPICACI